MNEIIIFIAISRNAKLSADFSSTDQNSYSNDVNN